MPSEIRRLRRGPGLDTAITRSKERYAAAIAEAAQVAGSLASQLVPVRTGRLKASIFVEQFGPATFRIGANAPYASYVELGTVYQEAQPFIRPAVEMARKHLRDLITSGR